MARDNIRLLDRRVARELTGGEKLALLLKKQGGSVVKWAVHRQINPVEIWHTLNGSREYPEHRQAIAESLGFTREQVDGMIGARAAKVA